jgi:hypothetical protein
MNDRIDPSAVLREAVELTRKGMHADALHRLLWFHRHALEHEPALYGVRLSFALSYWLDLANVYPPALEELRAVRGAKEGAIAGGAGSRDLFHDVVAINRHLGEPARTIELFRLLDADRPDLAEECYSAAEEELVAGREYDLCARYLTDLDARLDDMKRFREELIRFDERSDIELDEEALRSPERIFAGDVGRVVEILDGVGRAEDAERVRRWALATSDSPEVREAVGAPQPPP